MVSIQENWLQNDLHTLKDNFSWQYSNRRMWENGKQRDGYQEMVVSLQKFKKVYDETLGSERSRYELKSGLDIINGDCATSPTSWEFFGFSRESIDSGGAVELIPDVILEITRMVEYMSPREAERISPTHKAGCKVIGTHPEVESLKVGTPKRLECTVSFYVAVCRQYSKQTGAPITCWNWDGNNPLHDFMEEVLVVVGNHLHHGDEGDKLLLAELRINSAEAVRAAHKKLQEM